MNPTNKIEIYVQHSNKREDATEAMITKALQNVFNGTVRMAWSPGQLSLMEPHYNIVFESINPFTRISDYQATGFALRRAAEVAFELCRNCR